MAIFLVLAASEFMEHFQWKTREEINKHLKENKNELSEELADFLYWVLLISNDLDIDIISVFEKKMLKNK